MTQTQKDTDKTIFGFWAYLMTDCLLFAALFATFIVLRPGTAGGPSGAELFSLPFVLVETLILLTSSFTSGLGVLYASAGKLKPTLIWFSATLILGAAFLGMELTEFGNLIHEGHDWTTSAFLSAFFTLVGTHGAHIAVGILWMLILLPRVARKGLTPSNVKRLTLLSLFWHFLDVIWIFIFTIVYMLGALS